MIEERGERGGGEVGGVESGGRQAVEGEGDFLGVDRAHFIECAASEQIGEDGTRSDGGDATLRFEASFGDAGILDANGKAEQVAANRICHLY